MKTDLETDSILQVTAFKHITAVKADKGNNNRIAPQKREWKRNYHGEANTDLRMMW